MKYYIDDKSRENAYMQLYRQLRSDITSGVYKYGEKIPSKRMLALEAEISVITVEHAYEILCDEGYTESKERSGYFVTYLENEFVPIAETFPAENVPFLYQHSDEEFPFSVFARTMRTVISKYGEQILIKSPNAGNDMLRKAITEYLARSRGICVFPEQIVIGSGAEYLYGLIVQFLGRERTYALENPSYEKIRAVYRANGATCDMLQMGRNGILTLELERTAASALHVTPFRSFPSGVTADASKREEYIRWAKKRNGIIIEDDFDSEFTVSSKHADTLFSLEPKSSVIYINTFTRTIAPSMRIGYMVLPELLVEDFRKKMGFYSCTVPVFEQYVLAEFIQNGDFERHINRVRRKRRQAKAGNSKLDNPGCTS